MVIVLTSPIIYICSYHQNILFSVIVHNILYYFCYHRTCQMFAGMKLFLHSTKTMASEAGFLPYAPTQNWLPDFKLMSNIASTRPYHGLLLPELPPSELDFTKHCGQVVNTPALYFGGPGFISRSGDRLSWQVFRGFSQFPQANAR
jgi:hypothetical protein